MNIKWMEFAMDKDIKFKYSTRKTVLITEKAAEHGKHRLLFS